MASVARTQVFVPAWLVVEPSSHHFMIMVVAFVTTVPYSRTTYIFWRFWPSRVLVRARAAYV